jgi:hypothetical protein
VESKSKISNNNGITNTKRVAGGYNITSLKRKEIKITQYFTVTV